MRLVIAAIAAALALPVLAGGIVFSFDSYPTTAGATAIDTGRMHTGPAEHFSCQARNPDAAARNMTVELYGEDGGGTGVPLRTETISCGATLAMCGVSIGNAATASTGVTALALNVPRYVRVQLAGGTTAGARLVCYGR